MASSLSGWTAIAAYRSVTVKNSSLHNASQLHLHLTTRTWNRGYWCSPCLLLSLLSVCVLLETPVDYFLNHDYSRSLPLSSEIAVPCQ